jgi:hypothetical protein
VCSMFCLSCVFLVLFVLCVQCCLCLWIAHSWFLLQFLTFIFFIIYYTIQWGSYGSLIYNYLCNQCLSSLKLWVRILLMVRCTWYIMW